MSASKEAAKGSLRTGAGDERTQEVGQWHSTEEVAEQSTVIDALDYSWVVLWLNREVSGNPTIYAVALVIFVIFYFYTTLKKRKTFEDYQKIFLIALVIALFRLGYYLLPTARSTWFPNQVCIVGWV